MFKQPSQLGGRKPLVQFRAGRLTMSAGVVTADPRKGIFSLVSDSTGAFEVFWTPDKGSDFDSFVVLKGQVTVNRVVKCTTGRVFVFDWCGQRQAFFWLQDKNTERDEEHLKKLKQLLEVPSAPKVAATSSSGVQIDTLQRILADLGENSSPDVSLQGVLGSNLLLEALREDQAFYLTRLHQHLPSGTASNADIVDEVKNPQVSASAALLQAALQDVDGSREVSAAFHLNGAGGTGVNAFISKIIEESKKQSK